MPKWAPITPISVSPSRGIFPWSIFESRQVMGTALIYRSMMHKVKTSLRLLLLVELCNIEVELIEPESIHPCSDVAGCQLKTLSYVVDNSRSSVNGPENGGKLTISQTNPCHIFLFDCVFPIRHVSSYKWVTVDLHFYQSTFPDCVLISPFLFRLLFWHSY